MATARVVSFPRLTAARRGITLNADPGMSMTGAGRQEEKVEDTTIAAIINAVPLAFIGYMFVSLTKRIDTLTTRVDRLYELQAGRKAE